jgi:hypothetical protein
MLEWLIPLSIFWLMAMVYLGGLPVRIEGGSGPREVAGLLLTMVVFLATWGVLRFMVEPVAGAIAGILVATLASVLLLPALVWVGFRALGVRVRRPDRFIGAGIGH